ncbi:hypothetical protein Prudu_005152 [Prunus dulcis]|uniref:Uncharacterized protein n=1 Tax=Prunus dulcis TaxID=3755 RepID=A0A4Y1QX06_PRUDU|nr:hypothetical protein Prudu_005152 [Prunus dulcis]
MASQYQAHILGLNAYDRHKKFVKDYVSFYGREESSHVKLPVKTDQDTLREGYRFIRSEEDDMDRSWEQRLVKRYYDKLFKEYCIADMSHYKSGKVNFSYFEAGENKQALVKLVTCERCSEKLHYKRRKEKEQLEKEKKEVNRRKRSRSGDDDDDDDDDDTDNEGNKERSKGKKASISTSEHRADDDDDDFDEFLEGMFP